MSAIVVDSSVWIEFFRGKDLPLLEEALRDGRALLSPVVASELLSGTQRPREAQALLAFIRQNEVIACDAEHWIRVGFLRRQLRERGLNVSTPDAHVLQCALDCDAGLYSFDAIFLKISEQIEIKLISA